MQDVVIREAFPDDASALLSIYRWYVENTAITYEYDVPTEEEFRQRIRNTIARYPYLIAEQNGEILGYAYAGAFHPRAAYAWCAELSIYLRQDVRGRGLGSRLYDELSARLQKMGILNLEACIACTDQEDEFLTNASVRYHKRMGFREVGTFNHCGYKFGRWYDMIWMEKIIGDHRSEQPPVIPWPSIREEEKNV